MKRLKDLVAKLCSVKGFILILATIALYLSKIDSWAWVSLAGCIAGIRAFEKKVANECQINSSG